MSNFIPKVNNNSSVPKFLQLVRSFEDAVKSKLLDVGDMLPSVNELCKECGLSRDTVFKAYTELKNRKLIESVPNKGYYVASATQNVFLFLDTFKAYKEVLYGAFRNALPSSYNVDVHFHHYNPRVFEDIVLNAIGKYSHYIIMNFDDKKVKSAVTKIDPSKLLCIDWSINVPEQCSFLGQDFGDPVYDNMVLIQERLKKYKKLVFIYPEFTNHPIQTISAFEAFCVDHHFDYEIIYKVKDIVVQRGELYFTVSDRVMAKILDFAQELNYSTGTDIGIISYNETPTKKYIKEGITVISTDFDKIGTKMADFIMSGNKIREFIPTEMILRNSL
ncbi:GntR family transcriptional regulator [Saccharicrinis fermentans]|uniref:DNA-binding transcriptional repressor MngR n=1 Tax=Saccharicrinis fermentans DSM 9555 = JCM 21142 TaxID=869213 RepID=W7XVM3_9BACT|nr:GntR family transcriptional regulator [Saccharicrinis fermentans]GAF02200.1 DNA-binding transcriptional repressor MngR [Saccharicrinis fermentans DSM 9555 = JCM 21142]